MNRLTSLAVEKDAIPNLPEFRLVFQAAWFTVAKHGDTARVNFHSDFNVHDESVPELLEKIKDSKFVESVIDCPGGDLSGAFEFYDGVKGRATTATIRGRCYSAAVVVALAADIIRMESSARLMIHPGCDLAIGRAEELRCHAARLDKLNDRLVALLSTRTKWASEFMSGSDHFFSAQEALANGLVDEVFASPNDRNDSPAICSVSPQDPNPTTDELLMNQFLTAFGRIKVKSRQQFVHGMAVWACNNSDEEK